MIVLIDTEKQAVHIYGENGVKTIMFDKIGSLSSYIGDKSVYYVTNAVETTANDIINLVCDITGIEVQPEQQIIIPDDSQTYLHYDGNGSMIISDVNLKLEGKFDVRPIDDKMQLIIARSSMLQKLMKNGKVKVINSQKKKELDIGRKQWLLKKEEIEKTQDSALDDIIVDRSTLTKTNSSKPTLASKHDAIEVDIEEADDKDLQPHERGMSTL
jgi:hypothetical protein